MEYQNHWNKRVEKHKQNLISVMHHPQDDAKQKDDIISFFKDIKIDAQSILDYGCGIGRLTSTLSKIFTCYNGIDFSERMTEIASEKNQNANFMHIKNYDILPSADVLFCFTVLLHIPPEEIQIFSKAIQNKFKYIFIGEHMDEWATKKFREDFEYNRTYCFNRPLEYYVDVLKIKKVIKHQNYPTYYETTEMTYLLGEL